MNNKSEKFCATLNYIEHFLNLVFVFTVYIPISGFDSSVDIRKRVMSSTIALNTFAKIPRIKDFKSIT